MSENKERITVSAFVDGYNKLTSEELKKKYVNKHVTTTYVPILNKMNVLTLMNEKSVVNEDIKYINLTVSKLNLIMAVLVLYTDVEPDKDQEGKPMTWDAYDKLKATGILEEILACIGDDVEELLAVQKDVMDTWHMKNNSPEAYVANLVGVASQRFGITTAVVMEKLAEVLEDDKKIEKVTNTVEKMLKKLKL